jgi:hypothetical protein
LAFIAIATRVDISTSVRRRRIDGSEV